MRPSFAATAPRSTSPSPGPASVASRALYQSVSQSMGRSGSGFADGPDLSHMWGAITMQRDHGEMVSIWFRTALLFEGWSRDVRVVLGENAIQHIETGVAPAAGDERHALAVPGL